MKKRLISATVVIVLISGVTLVAYNGLPITVLGPFGIREGMRRSDVMPTLESYGIVEVQPHSDETADCGSRDGALPWVMFPRATDEEVETVLTSRKLTFFGLDQSGLYEVCFADDSVAEIHWWPKIVE